MTVSKCQAPKSLKVKAVNCAELELKWQPQRPQYNPAHNETYVLGLKDPTTGEWRETELSKGANKDNEMGYEEVEVKKKDVGSQAAVHANPPLKIVMGGMPPNSACTFRICAINASGRSAWSNEARGRTLAEPDKLNGFVGPLPSGKKYKWFQTKHEVGVWVPVPAEWKPKEMRVKVLPERIEIRHCDVATEPGTVLLAGALGAKCKHDEVFWELDDDKELGRVIGVTLRKKELMHKWTCFIDGDEHPKVDPEKLQLHYDGNALTEMGSKDLWD